MLEDFVKNKISSIEKETIYEACSLLQKYTNEINKVLKDLVAAICDVDSEEMLCKGRKQNVVQARWLYWYALKQLYGETSISISERTKERFNTSCITQGVSKMSMLIQSGTIWTKRWEIIKRTIKEANKNEQSESKQITVKLIHPKGVNIELKQE